jgi:NTE family protein
MAACTRTRRWKWCSTTTAAGAEPRSIPEVLTRQKDIQYATRSREHIETYQKIHNLRRAVRELHAMLDKERLDNADVKSLAALGCHTTMEIVHLTYPEPAWELSSKDADFSWSSIDERWQRGYRDALRVLRAAPWEQPVPPHTGVVVHEVSPQE